MINKRDGIFGLVLRAIKANTTVKQRAFLRKRLKSPMVARKNYFLSPRIKKSKNEYLTWLLEKLYDGHFLKEGKGIELEAHMFDVKNKEDYVDAWYEILSIDTALILHYNMDISNLILPKHQSEEKIQQYYQLNENIFVARYLQYPIINPTYLSVIPRPYEYALKRLNQISYCELGPGIPHGLMYLAYRYGDSAIKQIISIELIDYPLVYRNISHNLLKEIFPYAEITMSDSSATVPPSPVSSPNFVVGKDVFEHVHQPKAFLLTLMDSMKENAVLAVDIKDRAKEDYQHVVLELSHLEKDILGRNFVFIEDTSRVKIYERH